jgi:hypothetical protein
VLQVHIVTNYKWIRMEIALLPQDEWWRCIVNAWTRCPHFSSQTHL